jgi:hypothetical protein
MKLKAAFIVYTAGPVGGIGDFEGEPQFKKNGNKGNLLWELLFGR